MPRMLTILLAVGLLAACGEDAAPPASTSAPAAPAAESAAPAATAPAEETSAAVAASMEEEEFTYDPIDVSKLDNSWWQQYSAGS